MKITSADGHQFGLESAQYFRYQSPGGEKTLFDLQQPLRITFSAWTGELRLQQKRLTASLHPLSDEQRKTVLLELLRAWNAAAPDAAKKAAFDYVDAQRGFLPIAFVACLLFTLPTSVALLADSHQQFSCTRELRENAQPAEMQVVKAKKRSSRTFLLRLEFTAADGQVIRGQEEVVLEKNVDPPKLFPILYSPQRPECWSLTKNQEGKEVNWAKRRYFAAFALLFGIFFLSVTVLGLGWTIARWMRPRPYADEVRALFGLQA